MSRWGVIAGKGSGLEVHEVGDPYLIGEGKDGLIAAFAAIAVPTAVVPLALLIPWTRSVPDEWLAAGILVVTVVLLVVVFSTVVTGPRDYWLRRSSELRRSAREPVLAAGWRWSDAAPTPGYELSEAVFGWADKILGSGTDLLWPIGMSEVWTGQTRNRLTFFAGHIVGYAVGRRTSGPTYGWPRGENVVSAVLPDLLPELRLVDMDIPDGSGYGMVLPVLASPDGLPDRWQVQGFHPDFAEDLLTPEMLAVLSTAPPRCTIVIRHGSILCTRDLRGDFDSIRARLDLIDRFVAAVPDRCWNRATPQVAGAGTFYPSRSGRVPESQAERLSEPAWLGDELGQVPWQQAAAPPSTVRAYRASMRR